jgi:hypothetical protein
MPFRWEHPALIVSHRDLSLFLAWNDDTHEIMYMNSDRFEWAWGVLEFVGTTVVGTFESAGEAATAMMALVTRIEAGEVIVSGGLISKGERWVIRWDGTTWANPLYPLEERGLSVTELMHRCQTLGRKTQAEVIQLIAAIG